MGELIKNRFLSKKLAIDKRIQSFDEIDQGYDEETAVLEASRCLACKNAPCKNACVVHNDIPLFINYIKNKEYKKAYEIIRQTSCLSSICGRVCPHEKFCEGHCTMGIKFEAINIGGLERFVSDYYASNITKKINSNNHKIAIIGSGPAGLSCANKLNNMGYDVTVYEKNKLLGGTMSYAIPEYRLPYKVIESEINKIKNSGVNFVCEKKIDNIQELFKQYEAIFIATGINSINKMDIINENINGVYYGNRLLEEVKLKQLENKELSFDAKDKVVAVIGGGNVAIDTATTAIRLKAKHVYIIYRRSFEQMPANKQELDNAISEGVDFKLLTNPIEIIGQNKVEAIKCVNMKLGQVDSSGRQSPVVVEGSEQIIPVDMVIMALGAKADFDLDEGIKTNRGHIIVDENYMTSIKGVFASGDVVTGMKTVSEAMSSGIEVAKAIDKYLKGVDDEKSIGEC